MQRPDFDDIHDFAEFSKYYWYREELINICKSHGLKSSGSKIELNKIIESYFNGEQILPERKQHSNKKAAVTDLTLNTGLIECGFTFGNRFRDFLPLRLANHILNSMLIWLPRLRLSKKTVTKHLRLATCSTFIMEEKPTQNMTSQRCSGINLLRTFVPIMQLQYLPGGSKRQHNCGKSFENPT